MALLVLSGMAGTASATDVTVDSTQPEVAGTSYQTINGALDYIKTQAEPRVVHITGGGPYLESLAMNYSVTIKGDGYKPVIVTPPTSGLPNASINGNGVAFYTTADYPGDQTFRLENLTILPDISNPPTRALRSNNNNSGNGLTPVNMDIQLVDVLVTANNGSNDPVTTDGLSKVDLTGATIFADDPMYFAGFANVETTNTVITNLYGNAASTDGIIFYPDDAGYKLSLGPGTVISYMNRMAIQMVTGGATLDAVGTPDNPVVIKGNFQNYPTSNPAISFFNGTAQGASDPCNLKYVVFDSNNALAVGFELVTGTDTAPPTNFDHVAFLNTKETAVILSSEFTEALTFTNCTFVNNGASGSGVQSIMLLGEPGSGLNTGSISFTDCVIAGNGTPGDSSTGANLIQIAAPNMSVSFTNCGLPTSGSYSLGTDRFKLGSGTPAPTETSTNADDPEFVLVSDDFTNPDFLDVHAAGYQGAATGGADLHGYGDYVGTSGVSDWNVY